jgi:hypothetical protein
MVNEELIGGLISALSRGEPLQKAMMTFYNAGYKREEIEEAAKIVYSQTGAQMAGGAGSLQDTFKSIASKVGLVKKNPPQIIPKQDIIQESFQENIFDKNNFNRHNEKYPQNISGYGEKNYGRYNKGVEQAANKIERALKDLKQINLPQKREIINRNVDLNSSTTVQKFSDYEGDQPKKMKKWIIFLLVFLLILLLGVLAAVFFFRDDLIKIFNNFGFG